MSSTDLATFGAPQNETDFQRQLRREYYRYASLLETAFDQGLRIQRLIESPIGLGGRPDLVDDHIRAQLGVNRVMVWAWDAPTPPTAKASETTDAETSPVAEVTQ